MHHARMRAKSPRVETPLDRAAEAMGGRDALMERFKIKRRLFFYWRQGKRLPAEAAVQIEAETGVGRHELRPDLWSKPAEAA